MTQSRIGSLIEALVNVAIGYLVALASQIFVFPLYGIHVPISTNLSIGVWFTVISIVRSYALRRWFNKRLHDAINQATALGGHPLRCWPDAREDE